MRERHRQTPECCDLWSADLLDRTCSNLLLNADESRNAALVGIFIVSFFFGG
jgi:hypothetical protein